MIVLEATISAVVIELVAKRLYPVIVFEVKMSVAVNELTAKILLAVKRAALLS